MHCLLTRGGLHRRLGEDVAIFASYLAAITHDYEHKGLNNDFLVRGREGRASSGRLRRCCGAVEGLGEGQVHGGAMEVGGQPLDTSTDGRAQQGDKAAACKRAGGRSPWRQLLGWPAGVERLCA